MAVAEHETLTLDRLDRQIVHALRVSGRAPLRRIAEALGSSEQTVARRYRRLREGGVMRVIVLPRVDDRGQGWFVRLQVTPSATVAFAELLARRDDVSWVSLTAGGAEIVCAMQPRTREERDTMLLERLPRTSQVVGISSAALLHSFVYSHSEWTAFEDPLSAEQTAMLAEFGSNRRSVSWANSPEPAPPGAVLEASDEPMLATLRADGRASYAELAAATGSSPAQAARRLDALLRAEQVYVDVDLAHVPLGFHVQAILWVTVAPGDLDAVGRELTSHEETAFVAAISGVSNLYVSVLARYADELYRYLTTKVGAIGAIRQVEVSPVLLRVKQAGTIMDGDRLPNPTAA
jgi:DNA-binding Lrp family transcriptional regulator